MSGVFGVPGGKDRSPQLSWSGVLLLGRALDQSRHPHLVLDHQHPHAGEATQKMRK